MAETVTPESSTSTSAPPGKKAKGGFFSKYKWYIVGGLALLALLVFYFTNRSNANAGSAAGSGTSGAGTGVQPYSSGDYGSGYYGVGPAGATGATGPAGPAGPQGPPGKRPPAPKHHKGKKKKQTVAGATASSLAPVASLNSGMRSQSNIARGTRAHNERVAPVESRRPRPVRPRPTATRPAGAARPRRSA